MMGLILAVVLAAAAAPARADAAAEYQKGFAAFRRDDLIEAMRRLGVAADAGYAPAQALLGYIMDLAEDNEEAAALYQKAAAQGDKDGEFGLANLYGVGEGVKKDEAKAVEYYTRAVDHGHLDAMLVLGQAYINGSLGLTADREKGLALIRRAAEQGYQPARVRLEELERPATPGR
jgi:hypothetical protein